MRRSGGIRRVREAGSEIAIRCALRWHVWRPRTRLRLIRVLLSLEPLSDRRSEAHRPARRELRPRTPLGHYPPRT
jgi:hypothetical protein